MLQRTQAVKAHGVITSIAIPDFNTIPDQLRADEFLNEFEGFVRASTEARNRTTAIRPAYLPNDTPRTQAACAPSASVADNDLAVGRVVEPSPTAVLDEPQS